MTSTSGSTKGTGTGKGKAALVDDLRAQLATMVLGEAMHKDGLTFFPILASGTGAGAGEKAGDAVPAYALLFEAIAAKTAIVEEVGEGGHVPELVVKNSGKKPILIIEGEILVGAKQNRVVDITMMVEAGQSVVVPVACVEAGRWRYTSHGFSAERHAPPALRALKVQTAQESERVHGCIRSDQGRIWNGVSNYLGAVQVESPTSSLVDAYRKVEERMNAQTETRAGDVATEGDILELPAGARGLVVGNGGPGQARSPGQCRSR